jgi:hypothetical protein
VDRVEIDAPLSPTANPKALGRQCLLTATSSEHKLAEHIPGWEVHKFARRYGEGRTRTVDTTIFSRGAAEAKGRVVFAARPLAMRFWGYLTVELYRLQDGTTPVDSGSSGRLWATARPS